VKWIDSYELFIKYVNLIIGNDSEAKKLLSISPLIEKQIYVLRDLQKS